MIIEQLNISEETKALKKDLKSCILELEKCPPGAMYLENRGEYIQYLYVLADKSGKKNKVGITRDKDMLARLCRKAFLEKKIEIIESDIHLLTRVDKKYRRTNSLSVIDAFRRVRK